MELLKPDRPSTTKLSILEYKKRYGLDVYFFLQNNHQMVYLYCFMIVVNLPFIISWFLPMFSNIQQAESANITQYVASMSVSRYCWACSILITIIYFNINQLFRLATDKSDNYSKISQYSLILQNIGADQHIEDIILMLNQKFVDNVVENYIEVDCSEIQNIKLKLDTLKKQYWNKMLYKPELLIYFGKGKVFRKRRKSLCLSFIQFFGFFRDALYYEEKISSLEKKLSQLLINKNKKYNKCYIISFSTVEIAKKCHIFMKNKHRLKQTEIIVNSAFEPNDIVYKNLSVTKQQRTCHQVITYFSIFILSMIMFFITTLCRDMLKDLVQYIPNYFLSLLINWITIGLVACIPILFKQLISVLIGFEHQPSLSKYNRSYLMKQFLMDIITRFTIIYCRDFTYIVFDNDSGKTKIGWFFSYFKDRSQWKMSFDTVGGDIITIGVFYWIIDVIWQFLWHLIYHLYKYVTAISPEDYQKGRDGDYLQYFDLYISKLIIFFLACSFGCQLPVFLLVAIVHIVIIDWLAKFVQVKLARTPPNNSEVTKLVEQYFPILSSLSLIMLIQLDQNDNVIKWLLFCLIGLILNSCTSSEKFYDYLIDKFDLQITLHSDNIVPPLYTQQNFQQEYSPFQEMSAAEAHKLKQCKLDTRQKLLESVPKHKMSVRGKIWLGCTHSASKTPIASLDVSSDLVQENFVYI